MKTPEVLVNIKTIPGIARIAYAEGQGLHIGAAVTLSRIMVSPAVLARFPILVQAARVVGTTQLRNMGTVGGNICQRPRCAYFRHPHFACFKKGGTRCYAVAGEHRFYHAILEKGKCVFAHPSDMAPALVALKAHAVIAGPEGERKVPLRDFFQGPDVLVETNLKPHEFLVAFEVPDQTEHARQVFLKHRIRRAADFALASVALVASVSDGVCTEISMVLGGVAPFPYVAKAAQELIRGRALTELPIADAAEAAVEGARPLPLNGYKTELAKAIVRNTLRAIANSNRQGCSERRERWTRNT
jgi:xanthine dehydrogenase YagS FAD-binding subunit